ncbi:MAG: SagB/ThcOx family dehydrogenase [Mediterranea sp.]|jgi:SagB-type dehydrogenase family enzyme|nr:SagB/ThcOx family dehydrogenase [Mediterranea sp.]
MKRVKLALLCLLMSTVAFAADKVIKLPKPNMNRAGTVMKALADRHSTREYATKALSLADLSDLLWAADGVNRPDGRRTAPSAMNKQDVDVYVVLPQGSYLYDAKQHQLNLVAEGDHRDAVASRQDFVKAAPVCLVLVSDLARMGNPTEPNVRQMCAVDVGIISQNISIFCAVAHLGTVPRAYMEVDQLKKILKLTASQVPMLNHPVGYFK